MFKKIAKKALSKNPSLDGVLRSMNFRLQNIQDFSKTEGKEREVLEKIKENGYVVIPNFYDKEFCEKCIKDIEWMFDNKKEFLHVKSDLRIFGAEELSKNIMEFYSDEFLNSVANNYNAKATSCAFTLANRIQDTAGNLGSGEGWHRDSSFRQFKSIVYLNDVNENNGPFELIEQSHKLSNILKDSKQAKLNLMESRFDEDMINKIAEDNKDRFRIVTGKAGSLLLVDTSIIHRGRPVKEGKRYALTNYFFTRKEINQKTVDHFAPIVNPEKVLKLAS